MRPFQFFFPLALGLILFLFTARFIIMALLIAAAMSIVFHIGRRLKYVFYQRPWRGDNYYRFKRSRMRPVWKDDLLLEYPSEPLELRDNYKIIKVQ